MGYLYLFSPRPHCDEICLEMAASVYLISCLRGVFLSCDVTVVTAASDEKKTRGSPSNLAVLVRVVFRGGIKGCSAFEGDSLQELRFDA